VTTLARLPGSVDRLPGHGFDLGFPATDLDSLADLKRTVRGDVNAKRFVLGELSLDGGPYHGYPLA
jgi:hypothetical protein